MVEKVSKAGVIAFRLGAHHLAERLDAGALLTAAGACGVQDSSPGSALLALHARVRGVTSARVDAATGTDRALLRSWSMRGAAHLFPTQDAPVFTTGMLPPTEEAKRHLLAGVEAAVDELGMSLREAVERTVDEVRDVLQGRRLSSDELGSRIASRIATRLSPEQRARWEAAGPQLPGQSLGESVVRLCLRILTLQGAVCFAPPAGNPAPLVLVDEWLGHPLPSFAPRVARAELTRRYLHCYGPSTRADFAAWLGVQVGDIDPWWNQIEDEMTKVDFGGKAWMLTDDVDALGAASMPRGVRLLAPHDPYLQMRDRDTIVGPEYQPQVFTTVGEPGAVLADGAIAGTWRPRSSGHRLTVTITTFGPLAERKKHALLSEVKEIAPLRGAVFGDAVFGTY